jgi:hypothetical protein
LPTTAGDESLRGETFRGSRSQEWCTGDGSVGLDKERRTGLLGVHELILAAGASLTTVSVLLSSMSMASQPAVWTGLLSVFPATLHCRGRLRCLKRKGQEAARMRGFRAIALNCFEKVSWKHDNARTCSASRVLRRRCVKPTRDIPRWAGCAIR